jgi:hypothetical protein
MCVWLQEISELKKKKKKGNYKLNELLLQVE